MARAPATQKARAKPRLAFLSKVDWEIRDLIRKLNQLSFVHSTLFSCAGHGRAGEPPRRRHPNELPPDDPTQHHPIGGRWHGYVAIAYRPTQDWRPFHDALSLVSHTTKRRSGFEQRATRRLGRPVRSYHVYGPSGSLSELKHAWTRAESVIDSFLKNEQSRPAKRGVKGRHQKESA